MYNDDGYEEWDEEKDWEFLGLDPDTIWMDRFGRHLINTHKKEKQTMSSRDNIENRFTVTCRDCGHEQIDPTKENARKYTRLGTCQACNTNGTIGENLE